MDAFQKMHFICYRTDDLHLVLLKTCSCGCKDHRFPAKLKYVTPEKLEICIQKDLSATHLKSIPEGDILGQVI